MTTKGRKLTRKDLKEDQFADAVEDTMLYVKHHSRRIIGLLIIVIVAAVSITMAVKQRKAAEVEAKVILARGNFDFKQRNYAAALRTYSGIRERYRGTWSAADATFFSANAFFQSESYDSSLAMYSEYLNQGKRRETLTVSAKAGVAQSLEQLGRYEEAANQFLKTQQEHPGSVLARDVLLGAARCYRLAGKVDRAIEVYNDLISLHPDSREAELARVQVLELEIRSKRGS